MSSALAKVENLVEKGGNHQVVTANPEILYSALQDSELNQIIEQASLVTADGIGVVWAASRVGTPVPERVTGIDLMSNILARAAQKGWPCFFLGGAPEKAASGTQPTIPSVAEEAAVRLKRLYPGLQVVGTAHGYFNELQQAELDMQIAAAKPRLLFVGLGAPRQEKWIKMYLQRTPLPDLLAMGIGGSMDVFAGTVQRAPAWCQQLHIEWLYRLLTQPSRIKRQLNLPIFAWQVLRQSNRGGK
ncbi:WecB/TagA/CpsF family glycosyltransferase [Heliobacterium chlorum]|uniref:WecB/TagA/CpsF family glycosyltransferase n=2 Tax=Heliobacterium chlorum TaxID=2698 RepID=A0ABR7T2R6_HELCL|nr:WecB/TagA/CpsF family glycosyltransferase [Heliobacterium chlorum]MBC9784497.1 WecB/TagA/CpsF family glycosyltransferase [Heliobacterium chlorum]